MNKQYIKGAKNGKSLDDGENNSHRWKRRQRLYTPKSSKRELDGFGDYLHVTMSCPMNTSYSLREKIIYRILTIR